AGWPGDFLEGVDGADRRGKECRVQAELGEPGSQLVRGDLALEDGVQDHVAEQRRAVGVHRAEVAGQRAGLALAGAWLLGLGGHQRNLPSGGGAARVPNGRFGTRAAQVTRKMSLTPSGLVRSVIVRTLSDSASSTGPGLAPTAIPNTRKPSRCLRSVQARIHSSVTRHSPSVMSTMSPRIRPSSLYSASTSAAAASSGVAKSVPPPKKCLAKSRTSPIRSAWPAGNRNVSCSPAEENRIPARSRRPARAWSSSARAQALAHASPVM